MKAPDEKPGAVPPMVSMSADPIAPLLREQVLDPPGRPGIAATLDRFDILRVVGEGAMGTVLLGRHPAWPDPVAIKMLKPPQTSNPTAVHRFLTEARHMQQLAHPHILPIEEVVDRAAGPYFVVPYCEKGSLHSLINEAGSLDGEQALHIARQVADALNFAHGKGIIHRDLKPANVLLRSDGNAFLADFGLGKTTLVNESITDVTQVSYVGTAPYMSPEVAEGQAGDFRCDIYAFGAMLYEMLCSSPPYEGTSPHEILAKVRAGPPVPLEKRQPNVPRVLLRIVEGCMGRDLRDRYASMADVLADLERVAGGKAPFGPRGGKRRRADEGSSWRRSLQRIAVLLSVSAIITAIILVLWFAWPLIGQSSNAGKGPKTQPASMAAGSTRTATLAETQSAPKVPPVLGPWLPVNKYSTKGYQYDAVAQNGFLFVPGGFDGNSLSIVYHAKTHADGSLDPWKVTTGMPVSDQGPGATVVGNYLLVALENNEMKSAPIQPDGTLGAWRDEPSPVPVWGWGRLGLRSYQGRIYLMGGCIPGQGMNSGVYVAAVNASGHLSEWKTTTAMPEARQHVSVHFHNERAYIFGGITSNLTILRSAYSAPVNADGTLGMWRREADLPTPLWYQSSVLIEGSIFIFGGAAEYHSGKSLNIYRGSIDTTTGAIGSWVKIGSMPSPFSLAPGSVYDSVNKTVYLIGGNENPGSGLSATDQVWAAQVVP